MMAAAHSLVRWGLSLVWLGLTHAAAVCLAFGNFVVSWQAFEAQGFEQTPLAEVPFLGPLAVALGLGAAPLASLYALVLTGATNILMIASAKVLARLYDTFFDWRQIRRSDDAHARARAPEYEAKPYEVLAWLLPLLLLTVLV